MPTHDVFAAALDYLKQEPDEGLRSQCEALLALVRGGDAKASADLSDRFGGALAFGTAGMRAKMEAGFARMNRVSVAKAAWAIGQWLKPENGAVVVGHDARLNSGVFAQEICIVLGGLGFSTLTFESEVATPICAFAVADMNAQAGVMVTASHNPAYDNGIKIYGPTSAQISENDANTIAKHLILAPAYSELKRSLSDLKVSSSVLDHYFEKIEDQRISKHAALAKLSIVYTPLHGVGFPYFERAIANAPFVEMHVVEQQKAADGRFPTVKFPNPEEEGALSLALANAQMLNSDLVIANDPDADRLAVAALAEKGFRLLSGNEVGAILGCDVLENAECDKKKLVVTTLVSSRLLKTMAEKCGASYGESLTGFSRVASIAAKRESEHNERFVYGFEEALGYCFGQVVRDKDGINAGLRLLERASRLKSQGLTLWDELDRIALRYGLYRNMQWSFRFDDNLDAVKSVMSDLRKLKGGMPFYNGQTIDHAHDLLNEDYQDFGVANILIFKLADGTRVIARPSGTEPKLKFYAENVAKVSDRAELNARRNQLDAVLENIKKTISAAFAHLH